MFQTILFDLDGTLTDSKEGIIKSVQYALTQFGLPAADENALMCFVGPPLFRQFMEYAGFDREKAVLAVEKYRERYAVKGIYENKLYPGVTAMLQELKQNGKTVALATSKPEVYARKILDMFSISRYFDVVVGSELDGTRIKKAEVIEAVLQTVGDCNTCVMVGDRMQDVQGAKQAGIFSVGVRYGYAAPMELEQAGADMIVESVEELTAFLLKA